MTSVTSITHPNLSSYVLHILIVFYGCEDRGTESSMTALVRF